MNHTNHTTECPHCRKGVKYGDKHAGLSVNCPSCKGEFVIPAAAEVATESVVAAIAVTDTEPRDPVGAIVVVIALIVGVACGFAWFFAGSSDMNYSRARRFQEENAVGATANAAEDIASRLRDTAPTMMLPTIAGLLCLVLIVLERIRRELATARWRAEEKRN